MDCRTCQNVLPDLLLEPGDSGRGAVLAEARAHLSACPVCAKELAPLEATFALLGEWETPEISPWFDQKLGVRLREEQAAPPAGLLERLRDRLQLNTGRQFRPALAGALALALLVGGGSIGVSTFVHPTARASATVNDLQILDRNAQALQQVDQILQEDAAEVPPQPAS